MTLFRDAAAVRVRVEYLAAMGVTVTRRDGKGNPLEWKCGCYRAHEAQVTTNSFTVCVRHDAALGVTAADLEEDLDW